MVAIIQVCHMNAGDGETSYANNSLLQRVVISKARPIMEETIENMFSTTVFPGCFNVADLGCSSGPNTALVISEILDTVHEICKQVNHKLPEFQMFLNDLPGNDFNTLFRSLPAFYQQRKIKGNSSESCFIAGVPGSFYGRLFPSRSIHFMHSSYSLHWLSKVPEYLDRNNKRNIYISKSSPSFVYEAYLEQFQRDFSLFLSLRSEELVCGGRIMLTFIGRSIPDPSSKDCCYLCELLTKSLLELVDEGLIEDAQVDSFNLPCYTPYEDEVRQIVLKQGSFHLDKLEIFEVNWDPSDDGSNKMFVFNKYSSGQNVANCIRAAAESMLGNHFGHSIIDPLFAKYAIHVAEHLAVEKTKHINIVISMTKK
ncbi:Carboxyl methyltransferase [Melia azedarach]|uniref:Carboxyl methyltransferase n=1 Tax=Melia azedarach TaxID=155640 RepID=A0ACC1Y3I4_MELAZ|nr:Carboxyl methyltransferase [Melia azedarach]